jgi:aryl-alcohol dehydrogenase-like predicted oxidoreductase
MRIMKTHPLGNSDLFVSPIGFGAWAIGGGGWAFAWGEQDDADSIAAIHESLELGVNWIDTAPVYGLGHSEEVVARALAGMQNRPYVFTKCGRVWNAERQIGKSLKADSICLECEASLKRLKVDVIDLYQMHWPEPDEDVEEGWSTMLKLKEEGKVRWLGVSNFSVQQLKRVEALGPITSLQPPYHLLRRDIEAEVLPYVQQHGIGVLAYSPMASGLLSGAMTRERIAAMPDDDWRKSKNPNYQEPRLSRNLQLVDLLAEIGRPHAKSPGEVAIAWVLAHKAVTAAIVGSRRPGQMKGIIGATAFHLAPAEIERIESFLAAS